tara:strand:+ start:1589 stop:2461 length:873 start_codon:yes stop_codon:yes gene_type:complete
MIGSVGESMINIIGLGETGIKLADEFAKSENYDVYKIGHGLSKTKRTRGIKKEKDPEKYETNCPPMKHFLKELAGRNILIVNGGEQIALATLRILEHARPWATTVVYIQPDKAALNDVGAKIENLTFNILQEFARSGAISKLLLFSSKKVEEAMGDVPIIGYDETFHQYIFSSLNLINYFEHQNPVLSVDSEGINYSRIMSISLVSLEETEDKPFFDLQDVREKVYYCGINEDELRNDNKLLTKIKERIDSSREGNQRTSYRVYATSYEEPHIFCVRSSAMIQGQTEEKA